ncbi:TVP38/TMEM64 family protein [Streptococcus dentasini]
MAFKKLELKSRSLRRILSLVGLLIGIIYFSFLLLRYWDVLLSYVNVEKQVANWGRQLSTANVINFCVLILLTALGSAIPFLSNSVLAVFNGVVFGPWIALVMNVLANTLGNFFVLRVLKIVNITEREKNFSDKMAILKQVDNPYVAVSLGYMIPVFPTLLVNYLVTEIQLPLKKWLPCVAIGIFPTSCLYAFGGDAIINGNVKRLLLLFVLAGIVYLLVRKYTIKQKT